MEYTSLMSYFITHLDCKKIRLGEEIVHFQLTGSVPMCRSLTVGHDRGSMKW